LDAATTSAAISPAINEQNTKTPFTVIRTCRLSLRVTFAIYFPSWDSEKPAQFQD